MAEGKGVLEEAKSAGVKLCIARAGSARRHAMCTMFA